jgi:hypothetical protein
MRVAIGLCLVALAGSATATLPSTGRLHEQLRTLQFTGGPYPEANLNIAGKGEHCAGASCDVFRFTVDLGASGKGTVDARVAWTSEFGGFGPPDLDLYLYDDGTSELLGVSAGRGNVEKISVALEGKGQRSLRLEIVPWRPLPGLARGLVTFEPAAAPLADSQFARAVLKSGALSAMVALAAFGAVSLRRRALRRSF